MQKNIPKNFYRPEIDGLRAFAVIAVIINHFNFTLFPSGYLGVDIFFVISGYVITASISSKKQRKDFFGFISDFYSRRIKRLIPALVFYVISISLLVCFLVPENEIILRTGVSSLFGLSNFYLLKHSTDYFAQTTALNPFTHTWSLGVEEQFYFIFPILLWISGFSKGEKNSKKIFLFITCFISIISLIIFFYLYRQNLSTAYFLMPTRFWELSAGSIAFLLTKNISKNNIKNPKTTNFILLLSLLIVISLPKEMGLIATITIVLITILLLIFIEKNSFTYKILTSKVALFIGSISYSLYLWHWGVLSLSKWIGINNTFINNIFLLITISLVSIISYFLIENTFRYKKLKSLNSLFIGIFSIIFSTLFILFPLKKFVKYSGQNLRDITSKKDLLTSKNKDKECFKSNYTDIKWTECISKNGNRESIIIMTGDSMSSSMRPLANEFLTKDNFDIIEFSSSGTLSPAIPFVPRKQNINKYAQKIRSQKAYLNDSIKYIKEKNYKNKFIWIFNDMNFYFYGREWQKKEVIFLNEDQSKISPDLAFKNWIISLEKLIKKGLNNNIKIIYFGSLPSIQLGYEVVCAKNSQSNFERINNMCKDDVIKRRSSLQGKYINDNLEDKIKNLEIKYKNFKYIDTASTFCEDLKNCEIYEKGKLYMADSVHISQRKAIDLYPILKSIIYSSNNP